MDKKISITKYDGKIYDYIINIMGSHKALLTKEELKELYDDITELTIDDDELWER